MKTPNSKQINNGTFKLIDGQWHKLCKGVSHDEPTYLPATEKYFYVRKQKARKGELYTYCRLCAQWAQVKSPGSHHGYVPAHQVRHFYNEAVNLIGLRELARRAKLDPDGIQHVITGKTKNVRKSSLRKVMLELISAKRKGEHSIHPNAVKWLTKRAVGNQGVCGGCGTPLTNYTEGCSTCTERRIKRKNREAA